MGLFGDALHEGMTPIDKLMLIMTKLQGGKVTVGPVNEFDSVSKQKTAISDLLVSTYMTPIIGAFTF